MSIPISLEYFQTLRNNPSERLKYLKVLKNVYQDDNIGDPYHKEHMEQLNRLIKETKKEIDGNGNTDTNH